MGPPRPPCPSGALAVALFLLLVAVQPLSAVPVDAAALSSLSTSTVSLKSHSQLHAADLAASIDAQKNAEAMVVFGSGRHLGVSAHHRVLDALHGKRPVTVRLAGGGERHFSSGADYMAHARSAELDGAHLVVPAETFPCDVVGDVVEAELAKQTHLVMPSGEAVPYDGDKLTDCGGQRTARFQSPALQLHVPVVGYPGYNAYQQHPLYHKQPVFYDWMTPFGADVTEDQLQIAIGGTQRLAMKVHDAVLHCYEAEKPFSVALVSGKQVTVDTYDELLSRMVDPRYFNAKVVVADDVKVPVSTFRAVVDAHKHKGVYVVDPDGHRMLYEDYAKRRGAADSKDKKRD